MFEAGELPSWRFIDARSPQFRPPAFNHGRRGACSDLRDREPLNPSQGRNLHVWSTQRLANGEKQPPKIWRGEEFVRKHRSTTTKKFLLAAEKLGINYALRIYMLCHMTWQPSGFREKEPWETEWWRTTLTSFTTESSSISSVKRWKFILVKFHKPHISKSHICQHLSI